MSTDNGNLRFREGLPEGATADEKIDFAFFLGSKHTKLRTGKVKTYQGGGNILIAYALYEVACEEVPWPNNNKSSGIDITNDDLEVRVETRFDGSNNCNFPNENPLRSLSALSNFF